MTDMPLSTTVASGAAQEAAIERLLRRSLLALTRDAATAQDRLDFADLADAVGAAGMAAVVRNIGMLRHGFARHGVTAAAAQGSIERAVGELAEAMQYQAVDAPVEAADPEDAIAACDALARLLSTPFEPQTELELASLLAAWRRFAEAPPTNPVGQVDAGLDVLLAECATYELRAFLIRNHALAFAPNGSARLLHFAARLGSGGLGPYFSQVGNLVRGSQDVLGLLVLAAGSRAAERIERWTAPLASQLPEHIAIALTDDLADLGLIGAIRTLLDATTRQPHRVSLIRHLRDAALDLGDDVSAMSAQHVLLARTPYDSLEWRRLAALHAGTGNTAAAEAALNYALRLSPGDNDAVVQLQALRDGDFSAFRVEGGFMTPLPRKRLRSAQRAA